MVVESGVRDGFTSWLIAKATEDWSPLYVRVDPRAIGWNGLVGNSNADHLVELRGSDFKDIADVDWNKLFEEYGLPSTAKDGKSYTLR